ncbi:MAG: methyltransferase domain-containing protein, partial [Candidatus Aenigmarchaeota archaeon]|nr:methyltransferase domain-containing protein [Candidatus Aenigmarchaeota archaeon]
MYSPSCTFVFGDSKNLPFKNGCFDAVISSEVIEHVDKPEEYAKEVSRVLGENGQFVLTTPNRDIGRPFIGRVPAISLIWVLAKITGNKKFVYPYGHYYGGFSPQSLKETLEKAGLCAKKTEYCGFWLTKIFDDILYILAVYTGKTKESSWTEKPSVAIKLVSLALLALVPLMVVIMVIDGIFLSMGIEGYLIAMQAEKQDLS